jgi:hypothetical protein
LEGLNVKSAEGAVPGATIVRLFVRTSEPKELLTVNLTVKVLAAE